MIALILSITAAPFIHPLSECSILVPVSLKTPLQKKSALIGQFSQAWAGNAACVFASALQVF